MLQSQINYWELMETIRHNRATEEAGFQQAAASQVSANASRMQAEVAQQTLPFKQMEAESSAKQAEAALRQAQASLENAATNRGNLDVNRMNAATNARNADINQQNADINQQNADTNAYNAAINEWNAAINQQNANTNAFNASVNERKVRSEIALNTITGHQKTVETELTGAKIPEQMNKNVITGEEAKYSGASQVLGLIESGTKSFNNVVGGAGTFMRGLGSFISNTGNSKDQGSKLGNLTEKVLHFTEPSTKYLDDSVAKGVVKGLFSLVK